MSIRLRRDRTPSLGEPLTHALAHADLLHRPPLWDSLAHGFTAIETDIRMVASSFRLGHNVPSPIRGLRRYYLQPLAALVADTGSVYPDQVDPVLLLIDVKTEPEPARVALEGLLAGYPHVFSVWSRGEYRPGPVTAVATGRLQGVEPVATELSRLAVDGRLRDLAPTADRTVLFSDSWRKTFSWNGVGPFPVDERNRLMVLVDAAHGRDAKVRFWDTPDRPGPARDAVWTALLAAGVDYLGTDDLAGLRSFLLTHQEVSRGRPSS